MDGTILVADDDRTIRTVLTQALTRAGCKVHATASLGTLLRWVEEGKGDLVISDVVMPDGNGLEMLPRIARERPGLPVIVISAQNTIMTAIQAAEAEAFDYLPKPFDLPDLMKRAARAMEQTRTAPTPSPPSGDDLPLIGRTPRMQALYRLMARVMNTDLSVLISGESGTGKSLVARTIHDFGNRRDLPFVTATGDDLVTTDDVADLVARAQGGTILFDEVGDLTAQAQATLVRLIDRLEGGPRLLATVQHDLTPRLDDGFRADLYYRLAGAQIDVPALRDRVDDVPLLAAHFAARSERDGAPPRQLAADAVTALRAHPWPGNVRQLEHVVRRLLAASPVETIARPEVEAALGDALVRRTADATGTLSEAVDRHLRREFDLRAGQLPPPGLYQRVLREVEAPLIETALDATRGNQARCAEMLGINRNTLRKKITDLDIRVTRRRKLM
ncbi:response regulator [Jannaschia rubra]|uniref:DNA-binding transcriptional regulator NtrC n=1 Tax=Jannaschia rubra TaxID=282197 RepID=A0A0M6XTP0_9RHOB|nr:response regulator [Jannaschia rubra]CTQ34082.1 Nitrogen assimilation regulatory protein [Jannaschia rubra]SFG23571.1 two-component system, NtrC family, nitrogen regulation response regulator GlnG [Jannaschia rubra]